MSELTAPLRLDETASPWLVLEGSVDVFAVALGDDGQGPRHYLWSAEAGDLVPPMRGGSGVAVLAVPAPDTRLQQAKLDEHPAAVERLVANVSALLAPALAPNGRATLHELLGSGQSVRLASGRRAGIRDRTLWMRHTEGSTWIGANPDMALDTSSGWVPLSGVWIEAGDDSRIETLDTAGFVRSGGDPSPGLQRLLDHAHSCVVHRLTTGDAQVRSRREARAASDQAIFRGALDRLASSLAPELADERDAITTTDPLLAACRAIGAAMGIEFRDAASWEREQTTDLLPAICRASRVRSRRVALRDDWWLTDSGPLLGYLKDSFEPVALLPARSGRYELLQPWSNVRRAVTAAVASELQPFAETFYRPLPDDATGIRGLLAYVRPLVKSDLSRILLAALAGGVLALAIPMSTAHVFNQVIPNARPFDLLTVFVALAAATIGTACFDLTRAFALTRAEGRISSATQSAIVDRLLSLPLPFFRRFTIGDLSLRASVIPMIQETLGASTVSIVLGSAFSIVNLVALFYFEWRLALVAVLLLALAVGASAMLVRAALRHERQQQEAQGRVAGLVFQLVAGIAKLRVSAAESRAFATWSSAFAKQRALALRAGHYKAALNVFNEVLPIAAIGALFASAGWISLESLPTGDFVAFTVAFSALFAAVVALSNAAVSIVPALAVLERAAPILETAPEVTADKRDAGMLRGLIEGTHLTFRYSADGPVVIDDVSFRIEPGQFVAFVGPSGSGKSTLLRLLLGFETPETGAVYFDGHDLSALDLSSIRNQQLGVVLQSSRLMGGDIFTNIVGASSRLTLDDAWEAAEAAGLADDIRELPMGMHTIISEAGSTFSGGQRQRLLIARALVRKPRIILFDEATSALDNHTQETVTRTLELSSATRFVVAHRLSTIQKADRIFVMEKGRIVEEGSYAELTRSSGLFSRLIARQQA